MFIGAGIRIASDIIFNPSQTAVRETMNNVMVEFCAKILWEKSQQDLANQSRYKHLAKKHGKPITWAEINDPDIIPSVADQYRENVKLIAVTMRRWIATNSKDDSGMLDLFISATDSNEE